MYGYFYIIYCRINTFNCIIDKNSSIFIIEYSYADVAGCNFLLYTYTNFTQKVISLGTMSIISTFLLVSYLFFYLNDQRL